MDMADLTPYEDKLTTCIVVIRPDGAMDPHFTPDGWGVAADGTLALYSDTVVPSSVDATYGPGEWKAVGSMRLADGVEVSDPNDGEVISHARLLSD